MNMKPDHSAPDRPQSREAYGHPVTTGTKYNSSDHKPGHNESPAPAQEVNVTDEYSKRAAVPPHNATKIPKTPLSERIHQGITGEKK